MRRKLTLEEINSRRPEECCLTALDFAGRYYYGKKFKIQISCLCICGKTTVITTDSLLKGETKSCGCKKEEFRLNKTRKYTHTIPRLRNCYTGMIRRCYDKSLKAYNCYGGRGVSVCEEWLNSYQKFLEWALENGWEQGLQLDKDIKGTGLLYSPGNCCWVTGKINSNNTRFNIKYEFNGERYTIPQISEITGMSKGKLRHRVIKMGMSIYEAVGFGNKIMRHYEKKYKNRSV